MGAVVKYLCLADDNEAKFDALPLTEVGTVVKHCHTYAEGLHRSGHVLFVTLLAARRGRSAW